MRIVATSAAHLVGMSPSSHSENHLEPFLDVPELAAYLGVPVSTIYDWRTHGQGPIAHRFGKHLKFAVSDVREWVAAQRDRSPGR